MAKPDNYKPTHRLTSKQPSAIVGRLNNILVTKELSLEHNEDKDEKKNTETIMKDIQVQPWWSLHPRRCTIRRMRYKSTLSRSLTVTGQDASLQGRAQVEQSFLAGNAVVAHQ
eukprot:984923-Amphidinium_carterae.2